MDRHGFDKINSQRFLLFLVVHTYLRWPAWFGSPWNSMALMFGWAPHVVEGRKICCSPVIVVQPVINYCCCRRMRSPSRLRHAHSIPRKPWTRERWWCVRGSPETISKRLVLLVLLIVVFCHRCRRCYCWGWDESRLMSLLSSSGDCAQLFERVHERAIENDVIGLRVLRPHIPTFAPPRIV